MKLQLNAEDMDKAISAAILQTIDGDARERLLQNAIEYLISPTTRGAGFNKQDVPSPIQNAFNDATERMVRQHIYGLVESGADDPLKAIAEKMAEDAWAKARSVVVNQLAAKLGRVLDY